MHTRLKKNLICSVLCVDIVGQTRKPDADQVRHKARFQAVVEHALHGILPNDRVILDTGDGAAIAFLAVPEEALTVALLIADGMVNDAKLYPEDRIALRAAIHLGPIRVVRDINDTFNILGDGLNTAHSIMNFAAPGRILVSRAYYDMVTPENPDIQRMLTRFGIKADAHGREHDLYLVGTSELWTEWMTGMPRARLKLAAFGVFVLAALAWLFMPSSKPEATASSSTGEAATELSDSTAAARSAEHATPESRPVSGKGQSVGTRKANACSEGERMLSKCD
jgi:hypothetical protein